MGFHRGRAYGQDLRDRVLQASGSACEVAKRFAVSPAYVAKVRRRRHLGQDTPGAQRNHVPMKLAGHEPALVAQVQSQPDQTLKALCEWAAMERGIRIGLSAMWKTLARLGLTLKKNRCMPPSKNVQM
ncbi:MAG: hypothetical protein ABIN37_11025 [Burkholderiaceae bacterium]